MTKNITKALILMLFSGLMACSSRPDKIGNLDLNKWRGDRGGCDNVRIGLQKDFKSVQGQLKGKFADDIGDILGRPDIQQLGERNVKFYIYYFEKGPLCSDTKFKSDAAKVILKFNAVGLLSEITYQTRPL